MGVQFDKYHLSVYCHHSLPRSIRQCIYYAYASSFITRLESNVLPIYAYEWCFGICYDRLTYLKQLLAYLRLFPPIHRISIRHVITVYSCTFNLTPNSYHSSQLYSSIALLNHTTMTVLFSELFSQMNTFKFYYNEN